MRFLRYLAVVSVLCLPAAYARARSTSASVGPSSRSSETISRIRLYASIVLLESRPALSCSTGTSAYACG